MADGVTLSRRRAVGAGRHFVTRVIDKLFGPYFPGYLCVLGLTVIGVVIAQTVNPQPWSSFISQAGGRYLVLLAFPAFAMAGSVTFRLMRKGREHPLRVLARVFRKERWWLFRCVFIFYCLVPGLSAFGRFKVKISAIVPFYADPYLSVIDETIFGTDPWRISHALFGPLGTVFLDRVYILFFVFVLVTGIWMITTRDREFQVRALFTEFATWFVLGVVFASAFSSVGPIFYDQFYDSTYFNPLVERLNSINEQHALSAVAIAKWLSSLSAQNQFGSGISAMPSMHIAQTFLFFLMTHHRFGWRWPSWAMLAILFLMWIASFHLAWHYAIDGLVSIVVVGILWRISRIFGRHGLLKVRTS